jgi:superfamily I DNA/RNA helicase
MDIPGEIHFFQAINSLQENHWMGKKIMSLLGGTSHHQKDAASGDASFAPSDIAILVRFKGLMPAMEKELQRMGIPVSVPEDQPYFKDQRIELILRAVGRVMGIAGEENVFECPERVLTGGPKRLAAYLEDVPPFDKIFWTGKAFKTLEREYSSLGGWSGLMSHIKLESELAQVDIKAQKVMIMTMHAAKGLEFEAVFLPCLEDGIIPFAGTDMLLGQIDPEKKRWDSEEERRLFYVSLTRARRFLFLSLAGSRKVFGRQLNLKKSKFLKEMPFEEVRVSRGKIQKNKKEKHLKLC